MISKANSVPRREVTATVTCSRCKSVPVCCGGFERYFWNGSGTEKARNDRRHVGRVTEFVDPRSNPEPPPKVSRAPAAHGDDVRGLVRLCSSGRVYETERWIQDGRPI